MWNAWTKHMADEPLVKGQCPVKSCLFTTDMSLLQDSDVIVLHFDTLEDYPVNRQPHQRLVFYHFESPDNTASDLMNDPYFRYNYFNWTMTYRRDSDVFLRDYYGSLIAKNSHYHWPRRCQRKYPRVRTREKPVGFGCPLRRHVACRIQILFGIREFLVSRLRDGKVHSTFCLRRSSYFSRRCRLQSLYSATFLHQCSRF